jgi:hypothetical protein
MRPEDGILLSTRALLNRLIIQYGRLKVGGTPSQLGLPADPDPRRSRDFIRRLGRAWRGVPNARAPRLRFNPRAELYAGFPAAWARLQADQQRSAAGQIQQKPAGAANEWAVLNESPEGYALRYLSGSVGAARVGDLVVIRTRDHDRMFPCLVRWVRSEPGENLEIGLQQLRGQFTPATFRRAQGRHYGQVPILAAPVPAAGKRLAVVAPSRLLGLGQEILIRQGSVEARYLTREIVESTTFVDWVDAERVS